MLWELDFLRTNPKYLTLRLMTLDARGANTFYSKGARQWDAAAGEDVEVNFNMGTGEVTYGKKTGCCSDKSDGTSSGGCGCSK